MLSLLAEETGIIVNIEEIADLITIILNIIDFYKKSIITLLLFHCQTGTNYSL